MRQLPFACPFLAICINTLDYALNYAFQNALHFRDLPLRDLRFKAVGTVCMSAFFGQNKKERKKIEKHSKMIKAKILHK